MSLDTIQVHGQILEPVTNVPAVGTVTFKILHELRDNVDNIVYSPMTFVAALDVNGEFMIELPVTDDPDITPLDWAYWVHVATDVWTSTVFYVNLPSSLGPIAEFADLIAISGGSACTPDGSACAPIGVIGEITALQDAVGVLQTDLDAAEVTIGALVGQVNVITPIVLDNQADIVTLQGQVTTLQGEMTTVQGQIATLQANAGLVGPTAFVNLTNLHANVTQGAVAGASRLDRGADNTRLRGFVTATGGAVPAGQVIANIGTVSHRPLHAVNTGVRYSSGSTRFLVALNGDITLGAALNLNDQLWLDSLTFDLAA